MELVRQVLLQTEQSATGTDWVDINIAGYSPEEIAYHVKILSDAGLLEALDLSDGDGLEWKPKSLTWTGAPCFTTWRISARMTAELLIDRPRKSEASRLKRWRRVSTSWVRVWVRIRKGCFGGLVCGRFIGELISHPKTIGQRKTKYIQKRAATARGRQDGSS
jgi:uncharacterized protein DUF2513